MLLPPAMAQAEPSGAAHGAALRRAPRCSGRVLVADDESSVLGFMRELLSNWGLEVSVAQDGTAAQELLVRDPAYFDLLITDQTMPGLTGIELAAAAHALRPDLPVILYSGNPQEIDTQRERLGLRHVLHKPVEPGELCAALAQCLGARNA